MLTTARVIIPLSDTEEYFGYFATLALGLDKRPGILIIPEIFGVNYSIRETVISFARAGYTVLAPDLFWRFEPDIELGYEGEDLKEALEYYRLFDVNQGIKDLGHAIDALRDHGNCNGKIAAIGFCLGGKLAYLTAAQ